ncbi:hypothetical protein BWQ96_05243 [Gracilariopsis chorda]|uniref:Uncharacterized protein n=1 Tax=Gracilariopsis chorda TaxID=448386 RepID=A0A2V3IS98_9FLOR|nr:hypothetical protein BWQ96_05243 [Gracilariopsis chorda]|eukprot:PXF44996.1 hypothetical protein BWQ96_05243 [Gracilariopsis chorda]
MDFPPFTCTSTQNEKKEVEDALDGVTKASTEAKQSHSLQINSNNNTHNRAEQNPSDSAELKAAIDAAIKASMKYEQSQAQKLNTDSDTNVPNEQDVPDRAELRAAIDVLKAGKPGANELDTNSNRDDPSEQNESQFVGESDDSLDETE